MKKGSNVNSLRGTILDNFKVSSFRLKSLENDA